MRSKNRTEGRQDSDSKPVMPPRRASVPSIGKPSRTQNPQSLSEVAYGRLLDMLRDRRLQPNDLINERHLARELNVSRTPLREAIRRLEGEKILERQNSRILVVRPISIEDLLYICQVRRLVEGEAARRAAGRISVPDLERLRKRYLSLKAQTGPVRVKAQASVHNDLHRWIAEACGNPVLASIIVDLKNRSKLLRLGVPERIAYDEHLPIIEALIKGNGEEAKAAMQRHLDGLRTYALEKLGAL
jgi:DNA-binding GntR family transcriptional regulator